MKFTGISTFFIFAKNNLFVECAKLEASVQNKTDCWVWEELPLSSTAGLPWCIQLLTWALGVILILGMRVLSHFFSMIIVPFTVSSSRLRKSRSILSIRFISRLMPSLHRICHKWWDRMVDGGENPGNGLSTSMHQKTEQQYTPHYHSWYGMVTSSTIWPNPLADW